MKNSFSLFEIVITIFLSSFVIINSMYFTKELFTTQKILLNSEINKIDLLSTRIFLDLHKNELEDKLTFKDNILYFDSEILLLDVSSFSSNKTSGIIKIDIILNDSIKQVWKFNL